MTFGTQNLMDNYSSAEKICSQLDILLAQQKRLENYICQVELTQSGMKATVDSVHNILLSTSGWSLDFKQEIDYTAPIVGSSDFSESPAKLSPQASPQSPDKVTKGPSGDAGVLTTVGSIDSPGFKTDLDAPPEESQSPAEFPLSYEPDCLESTDIDKIRKGPSTSVIAASKHKLLRLQDTSSSVSSSNLLTQSMPHSAVWGQRTEAHLKQYHMAALRPSVSGQLDLWADRPCLSFMCHSQSMFLTRICESHAFQAWVIVVILSNTMFMAYESNLMMSNVLQVQELPEDDLQIVNWIFCILFSIELGLKLAAYRLRFFWKGDWPWNIFDLLIVATAVNDQIQYVFFGREHMGHLGYLRVLRAFKMVRMLRIFRLLRFLREMRLLVENIMGSLKSMLWASLLIAMVTFVFGLGFLQAASSFLSSNSEVDTEFKDDLARRYGSVNRAMLTMYQSATGGVNWGEAADPLWQVGRIYYIMFLVYISFFMFVVSNIVTSMFVDKALQASSQDQQHLVSEHLRRKQKYLNTVKNVFSRMEKDPDGCMSMEAFARHMHDPEMLAFCEKIEVEPADLEQFFMALSANGKRSVDLNAFVVGCIKLRGNAKSADLVEALIEIHKVNHGIHRLLKKSREPSISGGQQVPAPTISRKSECADDTTL